MREWTLFGLAVVLGSVLVVIGEAQAALAPPTDQHGAQIAILAAISEVAVLCISAQNHLWRMLRAVMLFFYWPLFYLIMAAGDSPSWVDMGTDPAADVTLITLAAMAGIALGLLWYLITLAQSAAPRVVMHRGERYVIKEDAAGPYLEPAPYERQHP